MRANLPSVFAAGAVALLLSTAPALAEMLTFSADLNGVAEVPPNDSPGTGMVTADYDTETRLFKWSISYQGLTGPATAAHFHGPANPDENAPPVLPVELAPASAETEADPSTRTDGGPATPSEPDPADPADPAMPADAEPEAASEAELEGQADAEPAMPTDPDEEAAAAAEIERQADAEPETDSDRQAAAEAEGEADADATTPAEIPGSPADPEAAHQITGEATLTDEQAADLRVGKWYLNIHTARYPDGELRGQLPAYAE